MKKFIILSLLVAIGGIAVGIVRRQDSGTPLASAEVVAAAQQDTGNILEPYQTAQQLAAPSASTTAPKAAAKVTTTAAKKVGAPVPAVASTTSTTARAVETTSTTVALNPVTGQPVPTTTTTLLRATPTCSVAASPPAMRTSETISVSSNMPVTRTRLSIQYPGKSASLWLTTNVSGAGSKSFQLWDPGVYKISVDFYDSSENHIGGTPACQTSFEAI